MLPLFPPLCLSSSPILQAKLSAFIYSPTLQSAFLPSVAFFSSGFPRIRWLRSALLREMGFPQDSSAPNHCHDRNEFQIKPIFKKMVWDFGLSCFFPPDRQNEDQTTEKGSPSSENNRAWLLAETSAGGGGRGRGTALNSAEPQSVHSSFRFSLVELDSLGMSLSGAAATVLMVNLDSGLDECRAQELQWRRIESLERNISPVASNLIRFSYSEILSATCNFSKGRVLGRGALSCVFRGRVGFMRRAVAIKRLDKEDKESAKSFCRELMIASSLHDPNIVPLVGFCIDPEEGLFLVYKFVSAGSLERLLHDRKKGKKIRAPLPWSVRYKVAIGVGEAIRYLHNGTGRCVVHRDIKPSNILLTSKRKPKLCDFGLASWTDAPSVPLLCKTVKGTFGYLAPEYFQHGKVSDKTDVYAFGVVLLELLTGRKPIEAKRPAGEENLVQWAKPLLQKGAEAVQDLLDPRLKFHLRNARQIIRMIQAAEACVNSEEFRRPAIDKIVAILRGIGDEEEENSFFSRKSSSFSVNGCVLDCYSQSQRRSELNSHLALAMLGVSELEDYEHFFCR